MRLCSLGLRGLKCVIGLLVILLAVACSSSGTTEKQTPTEQTGGTKPEETSENTNEPLGEVSSHISIGTSPVGSSLHATATGVASVVSEHSDVKVAVKPTSGLPAYGPQLNSGQDVEIGFDTMPALVWAYRGEQGFEKMDNLRLLVRGNFIQVGGPIVRADSGINTVADLKGKRVADYPATPTAKGSVDAALVGNNLSWDDVTAVPFPTNVAGIEGIRDNNVDAASMMSPTTPAVMEVDNAVGLKGLSIIDDLPPTREALESIPQDKVDTMTSFLPGSRFTIIEPLGFITEPIIGLEYPTGLIASAHLNDMTAYEIVKTLFEHFEELHSIHAWLSSWTPEQMFDPHPSLPYHPGAVQFFKDQGLWTDETEQIQQELLN